MRTAPTNLFYFEDTAELLLSGSNIAEKFLQGTWRGDGYYFTMEEDGGIEYNLPWFDFVEYYRIEDGVVLLYADEDYDNAKSLFAFTAISPDCLSVYCYNNSKTYTLYRQ